MLESEQSPTVKIANDLIHTRRDAGIESKVNGLSKGQISSVRQYAKTRLIVLLNRSNVLDVQEGTKGDGPKNYETDIRNITKEISSLNRVSPYLDIDE